MADPAWASEDEIRERDNLDEFEAIVSSIQLSSLPADLIAEYPELD